MDSQPQTASQTPPTWAAFKKMGDESSPSANPPSDYSFNAPPQSVTPSHLPPPVSPTAPPASPTTTDETEPSPIPNLPPSDNDSKKDGSFGGSIKNLLGFSKSDHQEPTVPIMPSAPTEVSTSPAPEISPPTKPPVETSPPIMPAPEPAAPTTLPSIPSDQGQALPSTMPIPAFVPESHPSPTPAESAPPETTPDPTAPTVTSNEVPQPTPPRETPILPPSETSTSPFTPFSPVPGEATTSLIESPQVPQPSIPSLPFPEANLTPAPTPTPTQSSPTTVESAPASAIPPVTQPFAPQDIPPLQTPTEPLVQNGLQSTPPQPATPTAPIIEIPASPTPPAPTQLPPIQPSAPAPIVTAPTNPQPVSPEPVQPSPAPPVVPVFPPTTPAAVSSSLPPPSQATPEPAPLTAQPSPVTPQVLQAPEFAPEPTATPSLNNFPSSPQPAPASAPSDLAGFLTNPPVTPNSQVSPGPAAPIINFPGSQAPPVVSSSGQYTSGLRTIGDTNSSGFDLLANPPGSLDEPAYLGPVAAQPQPQVQQSPQPQPAPAAAQPAKPRIPLWMLIGGVAVALLVIGLVAYLLISRSAGPTNPSTLGASTANQAILAASLGPESWENNFSNSLLPNERGGLELDLTDPAPIAATTSSGPQVTTANPDVQSLTISIAKAEVHLATQTVVASNQNISATQAASKAVDRWETLRLSNSDMIDLMDLRRSGGQVKTLGVTYLAAGHYTEIRLYLGSAVLATKDGQKISLNLTSDNGVIKIVKPFDVTTTGTIKSIVDLDAPASVTGSSGNYKLSPVLSRFLINGQEVK